MQTPGFASLIAIQLQGTKKNRLSGIIRTRLSPEAKVCAITKLPSEELLSTNSNSKPENDWFRILITARGKVSSSL